MGRLDFRQIGLDFRQIELDFMQIIVLIATPQRYI